MDFQKREKKTSIFQKGTEKRWKFTNPLKKLITDVRKWIFFSVFR